MRGVEVDLEDPSGLLAYCTGSMFVLSKSGRDWSPKRREFNQEVAGVCTKIAKFAIPQKAR